MAEQAPLRPIKLSDLLILVDEGALALPDFQRRYSWRDPDVRSLLATILNGWPAGLLLLMEVPKNDFFAIRGFEGGPHPVRGHVRHLVLDGQQRITAVYEGFRSVDHRASEPAWMLDLEKYRTHQTIEELEEAIVKLSPGGRSRTALVSQGERHLPQLMPLAALRSKRTFFDWRDRIAFDSTTDTNASSLYSDLNELWSQSLSKVVDYEFPSVVLSRSIPLPSVARIFERLNTSGMVLDTFDLVVAHVYREGHNIRSDWDKAVEERPALRLLAERDALLGVEAISLLRRSDIRRSALLSLDPADLWQSWPKVIDALDTAARFLIQEAGVLNRDYLPHRGILLVLGALAYELDLSRHRTALLYWVFASALASRFDAAVNTRVVSEYKELSVSLAQGRRPRTQSLTTNDLALATRRSSASVWLGIQAMIRSVGVLDLPAGLFSVALSPEVSRPFSVVAPPPRSTRASDSAAGLVLLSQSSGNRVEGRGAHALLQTLRDCDSDQVREFLRAQMLPPLNEKNYLSDHDFLEKRANVILQRLGQLRAEIPVAPHRSGGASLGESVSTVDSKTALASGHLAAGRPLEAVRLLREVLGETEAGFGPDNTETITAARYLASGLLTAGRPSEAMALLDECLVRSERVLGRDHPETLQAKRLLGEALLASGRMPEAGLTLESVVSDCLRIYGIDHPATFAAQSDLARVYLETGRFSQAYALLERVASRSGAILGEDHPDTLAASAGMGLALAAVGQEEEAVALLNRALMVATKALGAEHPTTAAIAEDLDAIQRQVTDRE